jgi:ATP-dependent helicase HrpA
VRGYPALLDEGQSVGLAVFLDEAEADAHHRAGVMRLYRLQTARDVTALQKRLPLPMPAQLVLSSLTGEQQSALEDLVDLIVEEAFHAGGTQFPRDPGSFRQRVESARTSLQAHAVRRCEQIGGILEQRRAFLGALNGVRANAGLADCIADMDRQLAFLFRPGFVREPDTWMHYPRYFKALSVRLERLRVDPSKDRTKWESIRPFQERFDQSLAQLSGKPIPPALGRFARLLQEFRVARFAPEVGAAEKVSPRRLEAAWLDVAKPVRRDTHS